MFIFHNALSVVCSKTSLILPWKENRSKYPCTKELQRLVRKVDSRVLLDNLMHGCRTVVVNYNDSETRACLYACSGCMRPPKEQHHLHRLRNPISRSAGRTSPANIHFNLIALFNSGLTYPNHSKNCIGGIESHSEEGEETLITLNCPENGCVRNYASIYLHLSISRIDVTYDFLHSVDIVTEWSVYFRHS